MAPYLETMSRIAWRICSENIFPWELKIWLVRGPPLLQGRKKSFKERENVERSENFEEIKNAEFLFVNAE